MKHKPKSFLGIMVDLETLDNKPNALVLEISAVVFDMMTGECFNEFHTKINPKSSIKAGLDISGETVSWWLTQDSDAITEVIFKAVTEGIDLSDAMSSLTRWYNQATRDHNVRDLPLFGNDCSADNVWIGSSYRAVNLDNPFKFYNNLCVRTLVRLGKEIAGIDPKKTLEFDGNKHVSMDDAKHQVKYVSLIYKTIAQGYKPKK